MKHDEFFRKHPVFTVLDFDRYLSADGETGGRARESVLSYHQRVGRVIRVRRGLYAVIPPGADAATYSLDPYLVASKLTPDAVLSHHTALEMHGKAHSVQHRMTYTASCPPGPFSFRSILYRGTRPAAALTRVMQDDFGVLAMERQGMNLRVASLERTLVDVLDRPDLSGSWEEIWRSLESVEFYDLDNVIEYVLLLRNSTIGAKVGFYLEQHRESLMVDDIHLNELRKLCPRQPLYLDRGRRTSGRLVSNWNLVVPPEVLLRSWGDVL